MATDLEQVYLAYSGKVMGYLRARVNNWADAEDICAEVFDKVQQKLNSFDESKAKISTWIYTITRNTLIDHFRAKKPSEELDENLSDDSAVDENLLQTERLSELAAALQTLPQQMRDIVVMRYYDGKTLTEIAEITGMSYGVVKLRHQTALAMLRQQLEA